MVFSRGLSRCATRQRSNADRRGNTRLRTSVRGRRPPRPCSRPYHLESQGTTITALMQDPESVPPLEQQPNELRQWDVATGKLRWSEKVAGAGWVAGTADGMSFATVIGYEVQLRDAASGKVTRKWATDEPLLPLAFSPDGKTLAAGITEWGPYGGKGGQVSGGVQFWDVERASLVRSIVRRQAGYVHQVFRRWQIPGDLFE